MILFSQSLTGEPGGVWCSLWSLTFLLVHGTSRSLLETLTLCPWRLIWTFWKTFLYCWKISWGQWRLLSPLGSIFLSKLLMWPLKDRWFSPPAFVIELTWLYHIHEFFGTFHFLLHLLCINGWFIYWIKEELTNIIYQFSTASSFFSRKVQNIDGNVDTTLRCDNIPERQSEFMRGNYKYCSDRSIWDRCSDLNYLWFHPLVFIVSRTFRVVPLR